MSSDISFPRTPIQSGRKDSLTPGRWREESYARTSEAFGVRLSLLCPFWRFRLANSLGSERPASPDMAVPVRCLDSFCHTPSKKNEAGEKSPAIGNFQPESLPAFRLWQRSFSRSGAYR